MSPKRVQLRRSKGYRKPDDAIVVARPTKWGNPYHITRRWVVGPDGYDHWVAVGDSHGVAVRLFREDLYSGRLDFTVDDVRRELRGKDLACWCPLKDGSGRRVECHADVLLEIANGHQ